MLKNINIRVTLDCRDEKLSYKMRESQMKKIPYTLVIGDKERDGCLVNYRVHGSQDAVSLPVDEFLTKLSDEKNLNK
jgi:threonyl-tRNA synthetase